MGKTLLPVLGARHSIPGQGAESTRRCSGMAKEKRNEEERRGLLQQLADLTKSQIFKI